MEGSTEMSIFQFVNCLDQQASLYLNSLHCPFSDAIWTFMSNIPVWIPLYVLVLFFCFRNLGWRLGLVALFIFAMSLFLGDQLSNLVKATVERLRPCYDEAMLNAGLRVLEGGGGQYGFYSAHAANSMSFACCSIKLFKLDKKRSYKIYSIAIVLWALLMGISRIFVGKHYLGDVCVGFIVGIVIGNLLGALAQSFLRNRENWLK